MSKEKNNNTEKDKVKKNRSMIIFKYVIDNFSRRLSYVNIKYIILNAHYAVR